MSWSVVIPKVGAVQFNGLKVNGRSRCYINRNVLHYERKQLVGKTVLNPLGCKLRSPTAAGAVVSGHCAAQRPGLK